MNSLLHKTRKFLALTTSQKHLFLQAWRLLGAMRFAILTRSFKSLVTSLEVHREMLDQRPLDLDSLATAQQVGWAVRKAAQFTPWQSTCLVQVLAAQWMLRQRGIAGSFCLGASIESEGEVVPGISAHAWLKCGDEFITGEQGHERYTVVSSFSWS
jgi:hypothetical protein